jgi:hypothetical protein
MSPGCAATGTALRPLIDAERWQKTADFLAIEERDARWWRDASLAYWMSLNGLALPPGAAPPEHDLAWYKAQSYPYAPGKPLMTGRRERASCLRSPYWPNRWMVRAPRHE